MTARRLVLDPQDETASGRIFGENSWLTVKTHHRRSAVVSPSAQRTGVQLRAPERAKRPTSPSVSYLKWGKRGCLEARASPRM
jgi:hypothetical protein